MKHILICFRFCFFCFFGMSVVAGCDPIDDHRPRGYGQQAYESAYTDDGKYRGARGDADLASIDYYHINNKEVRDLLKRHQKGEDIDLNAFVNDTGKAPIHLVIEDGGLFVEKAVTTLRKMGADLNKKDADGNAPIHLALDATKRRQEILEALLKGKVNKVKGAKAIKVNVDVKDEEGRTPLMRILSDSGSRYHLDSSVVKLIVKNQENFTDKDPEGNTLLHLALEKIQSEYDSTRKDFFDIILKEMTKKIKSNGTKMTVAQATEFFLPKDNFEFTHGLGGLYLKKFGDGFNLDATIQNIYDEHVRRRTVYSTTRINTDNYKAADDFHEKFSKLWTALTGKEIKKPRTDAVQRAITGQAAIEQAPGTEGENDTKDFYKASYSQTYSCVLWNEFFRGFKGHLYETF